MNKSIKIISTLICLALLASCSNEDMMEKLIPKEEATMAEDYLTKLREKDFDFIKEKLSDELMLQTTDAMLLDMSGYFRDGDLLTTEIIGSQVHVFNGVWQGNFSFEYHSTNGWNIANAAFKKVGDKYEVIGLNVYQTNMSQKERHAFNLSNKTFLQFFILIMAVIVPLFIVVTAYFCFRTPIPGRKWLWITFVLFGVSAIKIDWTSGQYAIQLLSIQLLGASTGAISPHTAWVISTSFPLGAIMFWFKRKRFIALSKKADENNTPSV